MTPCLRKRAGNPLLRQQDLGPQTGGRVGVLPRGCRAATRDGENGCDECETWIHSLLPGCVIQDPSYQLKLYSDRVIRCVNVGFQPPGLRMAAKKLCPKAVTANSDPGIKVE